MKQKSSRRKALTLSGKASRHKHPRGHGQRGGVLAGTASNPHPQTEDANQDFSAQEEPELIRIKDLPKEVGVMLITAGIVGLILPGPGTPAIIAGGLALWPNAFGKLESWLQRRYPGVHRQSMKQIGRFLRDLDKRYPYSTRA